ncbi:MAG: PTS sugar transporter subunit IIA [Streptococcaceae bacterium]|jgi:PTS system mannitol-specific IIA component|nr:PTS sugar transporter subunit IIA [Streptococcaceae bacterium]MCH4177876.1 PTS sugar transporter subunit IIA [Streptococcaceae bacterium]
MSIVEKNMIKLNQSFKDKDEAIRYCGQVLLEAGCIDSGYIDAMIERNDSLSVYMGNFIAIPHGTDEAKALVKKTGITIVQVPRGVEFGTGDDSKIATVLFGIAGVGNEHLDLIQKIAVFCADVDNVVKLADAQSEAEIMSYFNI